MNLRVPILLLLLLSGCTSLNRLKPNCEKMNEEAAGKSYAESGIPAFHFEILANQCAKYEYRVPSKQKFRDSVNQSMQLVCGKPTDYFQYAYRIFRRDGEPYDCPGAGENKFDFESVRKDASQAASYRDDIDRIDKANREDTGNSLFDPKPTLNYFSRKNTYEKLKVLAQKYNLFVSDLN